MSPRQLFSGFAKWNYLRKKWVREKPVFLLGNGPALDNVDIQYLVDAANSDKIYLFVVNGFFDLYRPVLDGTNIFYAASDPALVKSINHLASASISKDIDVLTHDLISFCVTEQDRDSLLRDIRSFYYALSVPNLSIIHSLFANDHIINSSSGQILPLYPFLPLWKKPFKLFRRIFIKYIHYHPLLANPLGPSIVYSCLVSAIFLGSKNVYIIGNDDCLDYYNYRQNPCGSWSRGYRYFGKSFAKQYTRTETYDRYLDSVLDNVYLERALRSRRTVNIRYLSNSHLHFYLTSPALTDGLVSEIRSIIQ